MSIKLSVKNSPIGQEKSSGKRGFNENPFCDEKMFDLDDIYNSQNDPIWTVNREKANRRGGKNSNESFLKK